MMFEYGFWPKLNYGKLPIAAWRHSLVPLFLSPYSPENIKKSLQNTSISDSAQPTATLVLNCFICFKKLKFSNHE
ncbi:MAG: hypothetical protein AB4063_11575 [Crocosphaera sp.]